MIKQEHFCRNCIIPDGFLGLNLDDNGLCNYCRNPSHKNANWSKVEINSEKKEKMRNDWEQVIKIMQKTKRNGKYDCVLGYSGGKDSTALLDYLVNELRLSVLAITIDTGFMTHIAKQNIRDTLSKINLKEHHLFVDNVSKTFIRLYRWLIFNHQSNKVSLTVNICDQCSDLIHSIIVNEAIKRDIHYVFFGYSPDQIKRYFYEIPRNEALNDWKPIFIDLAPFTEKDRKRYINSNEISIKDMPRILLPYHVMNYDEKDIISIVEKKGLIQKGKADPILTNCHVVKAAAIYDFYRYGGLTYALQYAELVRQAPDDKSRRINRKKWLRLYKGIALSIFKGTFNIEGIESFLETIGCTMEEILESITHFRNQDPNKNKILENLSLFNSDK
jgi:PP-loop superfamily ATP-utilizing enzyme